MRCRALLIGIGLIASTACAVGRDFPIPPVGSLQEGVTTRSQVLERYGTPLSENTRVWNGAKLKVISYVYAKPGTAGTGGVSSGRSLVCHFQDDVLVGHEFVSSFVEDHTDFDETALERIRKGTTTVEEAVSLLGPPNGRHVLPLADPGFREHLIWSYGHARGGVRFKKFAILKIDAQGVVSEVQSLREGTQ